MWPSTRRISPQLGLALGPTLIRPPAFVGTVVLTSLQGSPTYPGERSGNTTKAGND
jgi:hypothetical protein